jgi:hypothetical protein
MAEYIEEALTMKQCRKSAILAILAAALVLSTAAATLAAAVTVSGSFYDVKVVTAPVSDGSMLAAITTTGKNGYHCNMLYPWKLTVDQGTGITVPKPILKKDDAAQFKEPAVIFKVPYTATDSATKVTAALKLSLCDDKQCQMETVKLEWPAR